MENPYSFAFLCGGGNFVTKAIWIVLIVMSMSNWSTILSRFCHAVPRSRRGLRSARLNRGIKALVESHPLSYLARIYR